MDENPRIADLRKKLEKDPGSRLFAQLAEELRKEGKHDEAIGVARTGLEKNPNYPSARLTLARALLDSGRPREARPELEQIVKASPDNILASRLLGEALDDLGESAQAIEQFERTLKLAPGDASMLERTGELKRMLAPPPPARVSAPPAPAPPAPSRIPAPAPVPSAVRPAAVALPRPVGPPAAPRPSTLPSLAARPLAPPPPPRAPAPAAVKAAPAPAPIALDRDLASGTFSPGMLSAADIQKHFAQVAAPTPAPVLAPPVPAPRPSSPTPVKAEAARAQAAVSPAPLRITPPPKVVAPPLPAIEDSFSTDLLPEDQDLGGQTLPLSSLTLADLYLQQGLKAEASAVLSQVLKEEPENARAKSRFAAVSVDLAQAAPDAPPPSELAPLAAVTEPYDDFTEPTLPWSMPPADPRVFEPLAALSPAPGPGPLLPPPPHPEAHERVPSPPPSVAAVAAPSSPTRAQIRDRSILSLRAFLGAAEREAVVQRATERAAL